jgi:hypothetical protein
MTYQNKRRAARALAALRGKPTNGRPAAYYDHSQRAKWSQCSEDGIADLLTDIRHLCDVLNLDFATLDARAYRHYSAEVCEP